MAEHVTDTPVRRPMDKDEKMYTANLKDEAPIPSKNGFLYEWWTVFWRSFEAGPKGSYTMPSQLNLQSIEHMGQHRSLQGPAGNYLGNTRPSVQSHLPSHTSTLSPAANIASPSHLAAWPAAIHQMYNAMPILSSQPQEYTGYTNSQVLSTPGVDPSFGDDAQLRSFLSSINWPSQ
ncbi:hypothetical protein IEO21_05891 [Rhodonia placenta]|uniref:Uncharacterized protein n=1 Tax=Rhodonia placenta TaxID=104341 RepID=A0A8H7P145_9APHY|nr:hypothetical protein IEO21_05891 [Postia placenta]